MGKIFLSLIFISAFLFVNTAEAKLLPQAKLGVKVSAAAKITGIGVSPKLRADRRALVVNFSNLQNATNVSYLLTYKTNIQDEGAMGALNLRSGFGQTSELLFGTCSKNICKYHTGIKDMKLEISYTLKSGKKYLKKYKIKV